jgi:hypothetical protein
MRRSPNVAFGIVVVIAAAAWMFGGGAVAQESKFWATMKCEKPADMGPVVIYQDPNGKTYVIVSFKAEKSTVDGTYMEFDQFQDAVSAFQLVVNGRLNSFWFYYKEETLRKQVAGGVYGKVYLAMNER